MKKHNTAQMALSLVLLSFMLFTAASCSGVNMPGRLSTMRISAPTWVCEKFKLEPAALAFEAENPNIRVTIDKTTNYDSSFYPLVNHSSQDKYDIIIGWSREQIVSFAESGMLMEFGDSFFDDTLRKEDFFPSFLELGNIDGAQYMIPMMGELMTIVVRKDLFKEAGLTDENGAPVPAKDWNELHEYAKKLTCVDDKGQKTYGLTIDFGKNMLLYSFYSCLQASKGNIYDSNNGAIDLSSDETKQVLTVWQRFVKEDLTPVDTFKDMDAGRNNFKAGTVAMLLTSHSRWTESSKILGVKNVSVLPIPGADINGSMTYIHGITIPDASEHQDLAIRFIKEKLLSRDFQSWTMDNYGKIPSVIRNCETDRSPEWDSILDWVRNASTLPLYRDWPQMDKIIQKEIQDCVTGAQTPEQTTANMKNQMVAFIR